MTRNTLHAKYDRFLELVALLPPGWHGAKIEHVAEDIGMGPRSPMFLKLARDGIDKGWVWMIGDSIGLTTLRMAESQGAAERWFDEVYGRVTTAIN